MAFFRREQGKVRNPAKATPGPAERAARKKMLDAWIAKNPEVSGPLVARVEAGEITEDDLWELARQAVARGGQKKKLEAWIEKHPEAELLAQGLMAQLDAGEIQEKDFWWLLGVEDEGSK